MIKSKILIIFVIMGIWSNLFSQQNVIKLKSFNNLEQNYSIDYPEKWTIEKNNDGVISIKNDKIRGGIYISTYYEITFTDAQMIDFIVESNSLPNEYKKNIVSGEENGIKSWCTSYTDATNMLTCMLMYKRKGDRLWFFSTEIEPKLWKNGWGEIIVKIISSIKINAT